MDIHIQVVPCHFNLKRSKGKIVLHQKTFVGILNGFGYDLIFHISPIDIIILKITVSSADRGLSNISFQAEKFILIMDL